MSGFQRRQNYRIWLTLPKRGYRISSFRDFGDFNTTYYLGINNRHAPGNMYKMRLPDYIFHGVSLTNPEWRDDMAMYLTRLRRYARNETKKALASSP